ncbi:MAG TPA: low temperature requirement protein A [Candidatus Kapabacteria bacterium]|nr:low temperature requirement protein A [Candidatus Kapabacteria bacterium]
MASSCSLLWWGWVSYSWLGNQAVADEGALRFGLVQATVAMFVCALSIPHSFKLPQDGYIEPWLFSLAYTVVRATHLGVYRIAAHDDPGLIAQLKRSAIPVGLAQLILLLGAFVAPEWQIWLWLLALIVDYAGIWAAGAEGWRIPSPKHFAERYGLIIIVALGESIVATGVGIGAYDLTIAVVIGALFALQITICLWWLYFDVIAIFAERLLAKLQGPDRARLGRDSYSYLHFPMIVGIVVLAIGFKKTMGYIADHHPDHGPWGPLSITAIVTLCLGPAMYLIAHLAFRYRNIGTINKPRALASVILLAMIPLGLSMPAIVALGLVALLFSLLVLFEVKHYAEARHRIRHEGHGNAQPAPPDEVTVGELL